MGIFNERVSFAALFTDTEKTDPWFFNRKQQLRKGCCHNTKLMAATEDAPLITLPFDFDFAGLVNAPYAEPNPKYDLKNVRQRLYLGLCDNNDLLPETFQRFISREDTLYGAVDELELLSARSRRDATRSLNSFVRRITDLRSVESRFIKKCRDRRSGSHGNET